MICGAKTHVELIPKLGGMERGGHIAATTVFQRQDELILICTRIFFLFLLLSCHLFSEEPSVAVAQ